MLNRADAVSVADLAAAGVRIRPSDAATIVRVLALQAIRGELPGVPSPHVIRLCASGAVAIEGPVAAGGRPVQRAAQLLMALLPQSRKAGADAMPLDGVIAAALDPEHASLFPSLQQFADALAPFGAQDPEEAIRALVAIWKEVAAPRAATVGQAEAAAEELPADELDTNDGMPAMSGKRPSISDMRRARRATGLSLQEVSKRSRIPVSLLRQLEWGYLVNWPVGLYARTQLVRYARAAGLDRQFVLHAVWPLIYEEERVRSAAHDEVIQAAAAPQEHTIVILEPSFSDQDVLFETELPAQPAPTLEPEPPVPAITPVAGPQPFSTGVLMGATAADDVEWPRPGVPRRASMVAAAAVLSVAVAGGVWATRTAGLGERIPAPARSVRRVPLHDTLTPPPPATGSLPASSAHRRAVATRGTSASLAPAVPLVDLSPALAAVDTMDDESVVYAPAFADAGAAVFSDEAAPGDPAGAPRRQSLRITRVVDENSRNFNAQPSPDGTRVAFDSDRDGERAVFVADADGRHLRRVSGNGPAAVPRWSPDGRSLAYVRAEPDNADVWNLWLLDLNTGDSRRLTSHTSGQPRSGSWFADSRRIAYAHGTEVIVLDTSTAEAQSYQTPVPGRVVSAPAVSPDGRRIIFQVARDGGWLLELADASMHRVLSDPWGDQYTWSPDGTQVAYYSRHAGEWNVWLAGIREP